VVDYVLKKPGKQERRLIDEAIDAALEVMPAVIGGHMDKAMHQLHSPNK
jgi:peptidyl-tRNA hydrolase, PTH1 family